MALRRRLEALSVFQWVLTFLFFALLVYLLFTSYWSIAVLYFAWWVWDWETPERGGRRSDRMRRWRIWELHRDYFPIKQPPSWPWKAPEQDRKGSPAPRRQTGSGADGHQVWRGHVALTAMRGQQETCPAVQASRCQSHHMAPVPQSSRALPKELPHRGISGGVKGGCLTQAPF